MLTVNDIRQNILDIKKSLGNARTIPRRLFNPDGVVLHCTSDPDVPDHSDVYDIARYDMKPGNHICPLTGCPTITYHYFVEHTTIPVTVWRCLDDDVVSYHAGDVIYRWNNWNEQFLGVVIDMPGDVAPEEDKYQQICRLFALKCIQYGFNPTKNIFFHRNLEGSGYYWEKNGKIVHGSVSGAVKVQRKTCPGSYFDEIKFADDVLAKVNEVVKEFTVPFGVTTLPAPWFDGFRLVLKNYQKEKGLVVNSVLDDATQLALKADFEKAGLIFNPF